MSDVNKLALLEAIVERLPARLGAISSEDAARRPRPESWSPKEELGHLIDSAANNHNRIVLAQIEDKPALPDYDGNRWVKLHGYQDRDWHELIEMWRALNQQLLAAARAASGDDWARTCTIGDSDTLTLRFVFDDYVDHMLGHLKHIGVDTDALSAPGAGYPEKPAPAEREINELMARRWSPRVFEDREVEREKILRLLEAARWAPSCFNEQPWRYLVFDGSDASALERARACLVEGNAWALKAPVLMLSVARENFTYNEKPNRTAQHDVGLASENLVLEAVDLGLAAHQMAGFDLERSRTEFAIPEGFTPIAMIAIGYPYHGDLGRLPEKTREKELAPRARKTVEEIAFAGSWNKPYGS
ncbi:MAG TPA: nitroreductase family protein [Blastocatellia bacterium]|nr:nitroreductase family protein [Blastocatellia bacterium]